MLSSKKTKIIIIAFLSTLLLAKFFGRYKSWKISGAGDVIAFSPNSEMIAYATGETISELLYNTSWTSGSSTIEIRKVGDDETLRSFNFFSASSIAFSPDNRLVAVGGHRGKIQVWRIKDGKMVRTLNLAESNYGQTKKILFTPDGDYLISYTASYSSSLYSNSNISVWDLNTGVNTNSASLPFTCAAISNDGQLFALGGSKGIVTIHHTRNNVPIQYLDNLPKKNCQNLFFSSDNKTIVSEFLQSSVADVFVHRINDGKLLRSISRFEGIHNRTDTKLSPNSNFLATSYSIDSFTDSGSMFVFALTYDIPKGLFAHVHFWHIKSGFPIPIATIRAHWMDARTIAFSPDGKWLASMSGGKDNNRIRLWRMPAYSGWWWFLGSIALAMFVCLKRNELREWINR